MAKFNLLGILTRARQPDTPAAEIQVARLTAIEEIAAAEAAFTAAKQGYATGLTEVDGPALRKLADAQVDAGIRLDQARAAEAALAGNLAEAQDRDRKVEVARLMSDYEGASAAFRAFVEAELPGMGERARQMMALRLAAEQARTAAGMAMRSADPDGAAVLPDVEAWRSVPGIPEEVVSERHVELWLRPNGTPLEPELEEDVKVQADGTGIRWHGSSGHSTQYIQRRQFLRRERLAQGRATYVPSIATALCIPPVTAKEQAGWLPLKDADLESLAKALQRSHGGKIAMPDDRELKVTFEPIGEPINVFQPRIEVIGGLGQVPARRIA